MQEENPDTFERIASEIAMAERRSTPVNRALRWYLLIVCLMPTMICIALALMTSIVLRVPWIASFLIDGDWLVLAYVIIIGISTFILGFVHSRLYDARHPKQEPKRNGAMLLHAIRFFFFQLLLIPLSVAVLDLVLSVIW
jgi:hypothetical protein